MFQCCTASDPTASEVEVVKEEPAPETEEEVAPVEEKKEEAPPPEPVKEEPPVEVAVKEEPAGLVFGFLSDQGTKYITFTEKPVGMKFDKRMPIVINGFKEKSKAKELGVQLGWEMKSIGGASLEGIDKYDDAMAVILKNLETLPEESKKV
mmetsp:Transcript_38917/g.67540  ORF Transcript_38917/g.67540 Transcript_38917/m.67540 type:complete len:151 (-) Transcript_38917:144-596(-)